MSTVTVSTQITEEDTHVQSENGLKEKKWSPIPVLHHKAVWQLRLIKATSFLL